MPDLLLSGVRARPQLVGWLKGLGVLRVVAEHVDPAARLAWRDGVAVLSSELEQPALTEFLLEGYTPAPVCSPWNGGSGFFPKDKAAGEALRFIEADNDPRLAPLRAALATAHNVLAELGVSEKPDDARLEVIRAFRAQADDLALRWVDAAVVLRDDDRAFPPLLGTGGNDSRWDIAGNYLQAVLLAFGLAPVSRAAEHVGALDAALHGRSAALRGASLGFFHRDVSPTSAPQGEGPGFGNPWDLVLAVEGSLLMAAGAGRRYEAADAAGSAPFTMRPTGTGYGTAVSGEKGRAELWLPLWSRPATTREVEALLREGRVQVGRTTARDALGAVRAARELGVARGIDAFERYAILERAGQSSLALDVGRIAVRARPQVALLHALDPWWRGLQRVGLDGQGAALRAASIRMQAALFAFADLPSASTAQSLLVAMGAAERALVVAGAESVRPLSRVPAGPWLSIAEDGSVAFAIAVGLASLRDDRDGRLPAVRDYLHGTGWDERGQRGYGSENAPPLDRAAGPVRLLADLHARRHLDAARSERPLPFDRGAPVAAGAIATLLEDPDDVLDRAVPLARGLALLDHRAGDPPVVAPPGELPPVLALLWLAWTTQPFAGHETTTVGAHPGWAAQLAAGKLEPVVRDAVLRLRVADLPPVATADDLLAPRTDARAASVALLCHPDRRLLKAQARRLLRIDQGHAK